MAHPQLCAFSVRKAECFVFLQAKMLGPLGTRVNNFGGGGGGGGMAI